MHYISVTPSVWYRVHTTYLSHHHYEGGYALHICHTISMVEGVHYISVIIIIMMMIIIIIIIIFFFFFKRR